VTVEPEWLAVGLAIVLATIAAAWRFAGLRGDISEKWGERIDVAKAGLSEHATEILREMEHEIADLLGTGEPFDPLDVVKDPAVLKTEATDFLKLMRLRDRAESRYRLLLRMGPIGLVASIIFALGIVGVFLNVSNVLVVQWMATLGGWLAIVAGGILVVVFASYAYLQNYLSTVDVESRS